MDAFCAELEAWRRATTRLSQMAQAATSNGRADTELVGATAAMRDAIAQALRQAQAVERLAKQRSAAARPAAQPARRRRPAQAPPPEQARWMAELKPKGGSAAPAARPAPKGTSKTLTPAEMQEIYELFRDVDRDRSGLLEVAEFAELAQSLGRALSQRDCRDAMAEMDEDGSGEVDFEEFAAWWAKNKNSKGRWVGMVKDRARERAWAAETTRRIAEAEAPAAEVVVHPLAVEAFGLIFRHLQVRTSLRAAGLTE
jgi:hypothetical protein